MAGRFVWTPLHNLYLLREVVAHRPLSTPQWLSISITLSERFKQPITFRNCKEHTEKLLQHYKSENYKALKKSGSDEELTEMKTLLQDIIDFNRDDNERARSPTPPLRPPPTATEQGKEVRELACEKLSKKRAPSPSSSSSDVTPRKKSPHAALCEILEARNTIRQRELELKEKALAAQQQQNELLSNLIARLASSSR